MEDDFHFQYEDELEAMRELEDFDPFPISGRKSLDFSTPSTKHVRSRLPSSSLNDSLPLPLPESPVQNGTQTVSALSNRTHDSSLKHTKVSDTQGNTAPVQKSSNGRDSLSRKRGPDELYAGISDEDEDGALCIDAPLPEMAPRAKRPRIQSVAASSRPQEHDDLDDDDFEITPPPSPKEDAPVTMKKSRELLDQIDTAVNRLHQQEEHLIRNYDFERKRVHKRIPAGAFIPATREDGARAYMKLKSKEAIKAEISQVFEGQRTLELLGTPLTVLKAQLDEERRSRVIRESERLTQIMNTEDNDECDDEGPAENATTVTDHNLWVERYSPRQYTHLLSDESTNRTLLKWLKLWDHVVFNKELKDKKKNQGKDQKKTDNKKVFHKKNVPELDEELDNLKRPQHKIALLCGPPGLGKTTLAQVIARHAGYNVVEMNASDDRSADIFKQRIEAATQMKAVLGADPRPNCLIIDEIDGAPQPAINMLLTLSKQERNVATTKRRKRESGPLLRPIICICNDLYTTALRQLRQAALVITFPPTLSVRLASRLAEISRREHIKADLTTLLALCEKADNDIRSCLNTLQFLKSNNTAELSLRAVHSMSLGQKDAHKSLFSIWQHIFALPKAKRKRYVNPHDRASTVEDLEDMMLSSVSNNNTSLSARFSNTLQMAIAAGEAQKVLQGLYENYLESKVKDPRMEGVQLALEWIQFTDVMNQQIGRTQNYSLMRYMPYLPVAFHLLFAANHPQKMVYPHAQYEFTTKLNRSENIVATMMTEVVPSVRRNLNVTMTVTEVLPPLLGIIQPTLRPVNTQLYSSREKDDLAQLVRIMIAYNVTYVQERSVEGQYNYVLEPNLEEVTKYSNQKQGRQLTYAAKQLIAREIELEKMRRSESALGIKQRNAAVKSSAKPAASEPTPKAALEPQLPNHLRQQLKPIQLNTVAEQQPVKDFFGQRILKDSGSQPNQSKKAKQEVIGGDIWFRFKEGFTNAVRKTVRVHDLV